MLTDSFDSCCSRDVNACSVALLNNLKLNRDICPACLVPLILCLPPAPSSAPSYPPTQMSGMPLKPERCSGALAWNWRQDQGPCSMRIVMVLSWQNLQPPRKLTGHRKFEALQVINESFLYVQPREGDIKVDKSNNKKASEQHGYN